MKKTHIVKCRVCKQHFDTLLLKEEEWIMPTKNFYYHAECYNKWKAGNVNTDEDYIDLIYDLISRDLKGAYNYMMIEAQRKKLIKQKRTNKGIYYSLVWYHRIQNKEWKKEYGIGIVSSIYQNALEYWSNQEQKSTKIYEQYILIVEEKLKRKETIVGRKHKRKRQEIKAPE